MSPRKRKSSNKSLPDNLYRRKKAGTYYYEYQHPNTGKTTGMGTDKFEAVDAAKTLNQMLCSAPGLVAKVQGITTLADIADRYHKDYVIPDPEMSPRTKKERGYRINRIVAELGDNPIASITTKHCADFLDQLTGDSYRQHRIVLSHIMDFAITKGEIAHNPVSPTQTRLRGQKKERERLTPEQFKTIRQAAPEWFKVAMDISLLLCLGRAEVASLQFSDERDGRLYVIRKKVEKYESSRVSIEITPALREVLTRAKALPPLSPYVVAKVLRGGRRGALKPEMLTREFRRICDDLGIFNNLQPEQRPSFHEIRSLGSHILEKMERRKVGDIQALMARATEGQTEEYLDGHGEKWVEAVAGNTTLW